MIKIGRFYYEVKRHGENHHVYKVHDTHTGEIVLGGYPYDDVRYNTKRGATAAALVVMSDRLRRSQRQI